MRTILCFLVLVITGCASHPPAAHFNDLKPTVILVSFDGFRADYIDKMHPPHFLELAKSGVRAHSLIPVFPSVTFPNHYSMITGLIPEHHGIVHNDMWDPDTQKKFSLKDRATIDEADWWGGEPLWQTLEKNGQIGASMFWVGSSAQGKYPRYWHPYDKSKSRSSRVKQVLEWLDLPVDARPTLITLYFEDVDNAGHEFGPESTEVRKAVQDVDEALGQLMEGLKTRGISEKVNVVLVSDHGMLRIPAHKMVDISPRLKDFPGKIVGSGALVGLFPEKGTEEKWARILKNKAAHYKVYKKKNFPVEFRYRNHPRIAPILLFADFGWYLKTQPPAPDEKPLVGAHGFDPSLPAMHGIFIARGPAFKTGATIPSFQSINLYSLLCKVLDIKPAKNDGSWDRAKGALR